MFIDLSLTLVQLSEAVDDVPSQHHEGVLMIHVVAVDQVSPHEISECQPDPQRMLAGHRVDVSPRVVRFLPAVKRDDIGVLSWKADVYSLRSLNNSALFEVNVYRVDPVARKSIIPDVPFFGRIPQHYVVRDACVEYLAVDAERVGSTYKLEGPYKGAARLRSRYGR